MVTEIYTRSASMYENNFGLHAYNILHNLYKCRALTVDQSRKKFLPALQNANWNNDNVDLVLPSLCALHAKDYAICCKSGDMHMTITLEPCTMHLKKLGFPYKG